jgi:AcrR family transcriptional regulator
MAQDTQTRTRMSADERHQQLLDVTAALVVDNGFHDLSIDAIAKRAGITRAVVYQHFDNLEALLDALIDRSVERARAAAGEAEEEISGQTSAHDLLLASVSSYIRAASKDPTSWLLILRQPDGAPTALQERLGQTRVELLAGMTAAVRPILSGSDDPHLTASVLASIANHYTHMNLTDPDAYPVERLVEHADWMIRGFLAGPRQERRY